MPNKDLMDQIEMANRFAAHTGTHVVGVKKYINPKTGKVEIEFEYESIK